MTDAKDEADRALLVLRQLNDSDFMTPRAEFEAARLTLGLYRQTLLDLLDAARAGDPFNPDSSASSAEALRKALERAMDSERRHNEWLARQTGTHGEADVDFDAVRRQIGCRIARIRECCAEDGVPGEPDEG